MKMRRRANQEGQQWSQANESIPSVRAEIHREDDRPAAWIIMKIASGVSRGRGYNFCGTIAVTEVRDFEAPLLVQSHSSHVGEPILALVGA
jgi:hypothetical protein